MASIARLPIGKLCAVAAITLGVTLSRTNNKALLLRTFTGPGSTSRIIAILILLANLKNLPFAWHYRVLNSFFVHLIFGKQSFSSTATGPRALGPAALFQPTITSSRSPLYECDYNLHKSNSTYFSDLDITRSHNVCLLLKDGIQALKDNSKTHKIKAPDGSTPKGNYFIMLGATMCSFRREIKPYESYEMWSRILCWDRKWLYIITHFVKKDAVKPDGYTVGPPSKSMLAGLFGAKKSKKSGKQEIPEISTFAPWPENKAIYASAISKYVQKIGRLTIHPEIILDASGLLPSRPGGWAKMSGSSSPSVESGLVEDGAAMNGAAAIGAAVNGAALHGSALNGSADLGQETHVSGEDEWDWKRVEAENARGLKLAENFGALEGLHEQFTGENRPALGVYRDFIW